ncbi:hypothetical protein LOK49_LG09G01754 [Camellia lanceoleosa]|uniref:Uncharacterized protein n=1 Tax=Camellia lanceoleosa TaxID=1840588 RepID=A0ACC0GFE1_9ERIC|nr:hypothetical protein LOK49_LG09G01754 [Camellia lanceoleosa]
MHCRKSSLSVLIAQPKALSLRSNHTLEALFSVHFASLMRHHQPPLAFPPPPPPASADSTPQLPHSNPTKISLISSSICFSQTLLLHD